MISVSLSWIAEKVEGQLTGTDIHISEVCTDTRDMHADSLFVALVGPNFDGHAFVEKATQGGACALLVSEVVASDLPMILVSDTRIALGKLAAAVKAKLAPKTVGITGSSGKTTVKEMVASILSRRGEVLATKGNFNNDIGVPLTLLRLQAQHDYAVIEMGANHIGEIAYTTNLVKPDVATIVNAAASHLEGFGSLLGVARAKSEIFQGLDNTGTAVLNGDSQFLDFWQQKINGPRIQRFSQHSMADFYAKSTKLQHDGCASFELVTPSGNAWINLVLPGMHNVGNALVAAALAMGVGASLEDIQLGLENMTEVKGRMNITEYGELRLLDDTYNANVASVKAAIDLLASFSGERVLILGDMAELGEKARFYHDEIGHYARQRGIERILTLGVLSQHTSAVFQQDGQHFSELVDVVASATQTIEGSKGKMNILVKGSRSARMERVVDALKQVCEAGSSDKPGDVAC